MEDVSGLDLRADRVRFTKHPAASERFIKLPPTLRDCALGS
jgi:hypothetical protein